MARECVALLMKRYLCEFDFRYNERKVTDFERTEKALEGIRGKRLTYEGPSAQEMTC